MAIGEVTLQQRYPDVFRQSPAKRFLPLLIAAGTVLYVCYAVWFFNLPQILGAAHWERVGIYLSQWISYDIQPQFRLDADKITPQYPRFSALGNDPHPDWVKTDAASDKWEVDASGADRSVVFTKAEATIVNGPESVAIALTSGKPVVQGTAPDWLKVYDDEVVADFGFAGEIRVSADRVKVRKKFLGWPNFVFDTNSPFFGKSAGEVLALVTHGPDLVAGTPNWRLAFKNFWDNNQWQHGDVLIKLAQTLVMAFLGTLLGRWWRFRWRSLRRAISPRTGRSTGH